MKFVQCPRCELNYMPAEAQYCNVCLKEMSSSGPVDEVELCSVCNENPVVPGHDVCAVCLKEMNGSSVSGDGSQDERVDSIEIGMESMATMDEILPMDNDNDAEYGDMENALSLDEVREQEESQEDDEDEDEE